MKLVDVVIGDIHARQDAFRALLEKIGIITINSGDPMTDVRNPGFRIHQLGDAVSLGYGEKEATFLDYLLHILTDDDILLLGNHELPFIWPGHSFDFGGIEDHDPEAASIVERMWRHGMYSAASSVGDWLITHAGLIPRYQRSYLEAGATMAEVALDLDKKLMQHLEDGDIGQAYGPLMGVTDDMGGIFWVRTEGHRAWYVQDLHFKQIFGHTPIGPARWGDLWLIDTSPNEDCQKKMAKGIRPMRSDFGDVAALVFETPESEPVLVRPYE